MKHTSILNIINPILITILLFSGCGSDTENNDSEKPNEVIPVETALVKEDSIQRTLEFTSTLEAWEQTNLGAQSPGRIDKILVEEGDRVSKGDVLVQMDDAQLKQVRIQFMIAESDFHRMDTLLKVGSISRQQYEKAEAQYKTTKTSYELILGNTQLTAPINGIITAKYMNVGEVFIMAPGPSGAPAILAIKQFNPLKTIIHISEKHFPDIQKGMKANVTVDVYPGKNHEGTVSKIFPTVEPSTRTFSVEIKIPNHAEALRPGMFARIEVDLGIAAALVVPKSALIKQPGTSNKYCFIVEDNIAVRKPVQPGKEYNELIEIVTGLKQGDTLVINGQGKLKDGSEVKITE
ncbi:MAG: efflux RND transporter periplasmic adaptor subunit [Bacteroidota bacterium]